MKTEKEETPEDVFFRQDRNEFEIDGFKFVVVKLPWGATKRIAKKNMVAVTELGVREIDSAQYHSDILLEALVEAPFDVNRTNIDRLSAEMFLRLMNEVYTVNQPPGESDASKNSYAASMVENLRGTTNRSK